MISYIRLNSRRSAIMRLRRSSLYCMAKSTSLVISISIDVKKPGQIGYPGFVPPDICL